MKENLPLLDLQAFATPSISPFQHRMGLFDSADGCDFLQSKREYRAIWFVSYLWQWYPWPWRHSTRRTHGVEYSFDRMIVSNNEIMSMKHACIYTQWNLRTSLSMFARISRANSSATYIYHQVFVWIVGIFRMVTTYTNARVYVCVCVSNEFSFLYLVVCGNAFFRHLVTHLLAKVPQTFVCSGWVVIATATHIWCCASCWCIIAFSFLRTCCCYWFILAAATFQW